MLKQVDFGFGESEKVELEKHTIFVQESKTIPFQSQKWRGQRSSDLRSR